MQTLHIALAILIIAVVVATLYFRRRRKGGATPDGGSGTRSGVRNPRDHTDQR